MGHQTTSVSKTDTMPRQDESTLAGTGACLVSSPDSDLSDLSELSDTEIAMLDQPYLDKSVIHDTLQSRFSNVDTNQLVEVERKNETEEMDVDEARESDQLQLVGFAPGSARPQKRKRMSGSEIDLDTVAAISIFADDNTVHESPPAASERSTISPYSSPLIPGPDTSTASNSSGKNTRLPHPKVTLRAAPARSLRIKFPKPSESAKPDFKMTILPKAELDSLKSHNGILRSHNVSLARQNLALRHANADAILLHQEVKDSGFVDHGECVRKHDYEELMTENQKLRTEIPQLRYEHQLMQECGMEWARRENMWEVEKDLFKNEVDECVTRIKDLETREQDLVTSLQETAGRARHFEQEFAVARARAAVLEEQVVQMQMYIRSRGQVHNVRQLQNGDQSIHPGF